MTKKTAETLTRIVVYDQIDQVWCPCGWSASTEGSNCGAEMARLIEAHVCVTERAKKRTK